MNFLEIANYVIDAQDGDYLTTVYADNLTALPQEVRRLRNNINRAVNHVKMVIGMKNESVETDFTLSTVAGAETIDIPSTILDIYYLSTSANGFPIRIIDWVEYEAVKINNYPINDYYGISSLASIFNRKVYLYPTPETSGTLNAKGLKAFVSLNLDDDIPDLLPEFHQVIADFALFYEMVYENNPASAGQQAIAIESLAMAKKSAKKHFTEPPRMITGREAVRRTSSWSFLRGF